MEYKHTFLSGKVVKDIDERLSSGDSLVDAQNVSVIVPDNGQKGVLKNVLGNIRKSNYNITGAKTIGVGANSTKSLIYDFISGTNFDYIMEYNAKTNTSAVVLQSTVGTRLNFNPNKRILNVDIISSGDAGGDLLAWSGDNNEPRIINIERAKTWGADNFTSSEIKVIKAPPTYPISLNPVNALNNQESNELEDRFVSFCYRYRYKDGYYSAVSTWTRYFFVPGAFRLDFNSFENLGMLNIYNAVELYFLTGPREVERIDLCFKLSNSTSIYVIDKFVKSEEGWADNTTQVVQYNNNKVYYPLPESEYFRSFDDVPLLALAQTTAGNRLMYANFLEGRDLIDKFGQPVVMDYTVDFVANNITTTTFEVTNSTVTYNYEGSPVNVPKALITVSFLDSNAVPVPLVAGASIFIYFTLISSTLDINFSKQFFFILDADYTDLSDLLANSNFVNDLSVEFEEFFENNGGITPPNNTINTTVLQGFSVTASGDDLNITLPVIKYEIDNSPSANTFVYDYWQDLNTTSSYVNIGTSSSMKSRRSYEVCIIYRDLECRKTTALTSELDTIFIPNENCITQNILKVSIPITQLPPVWAKTYKFGVKVNKGIYEQVMCSIFFKDGSYRWIKLDGVNKNKVKQGDVLVVKKANALPTTGVIKVTVLDVIDQPRNFITGNSSGTSSDIQEPAGLYMKIQPDQFDIDYNEDEFLNFAQVSGISNLPQVAVYLGGLRKYNSNTMVWEDIPIPQGSTIVISISVDPAGFTTTKYVKQYTVQNNYASFEDWFASEVSLPLIPTTQGTGPVITFSDLTFVDRPNGDRALRIGSPLSNQFHPVLSGALNIRSVDGYFIFETTPLDIDDGIFYETPEVYDVVNGLHPQVDHFLTETFNCFCFGNGAESYQIRDAFNEKYISIDFCPTAVSEDQYQQVNRFADIIYSGVFNSNTNVNKLNEFNLFLAPYKDDIEKSFGAIKKIKGFDTNLDVYQEDKCSVVYYGKDLLFNADGTTNLTGIPQVLGQQKTLDGEYGTQFPDSFDFYGFNRYIADPKRGVVIKKSNNGLFPISSQGMEFYFRELFRNNTITQVNGKYDQFYGTYILNIQYLERGSIETTYVTWLYSDSADGWLTRHTFNPEDMIRLNGDLYSFKNGEVYLHNQAGTIGDNYNTFYGQSSPTTFAFNFSNDPSTRKNYKTISLEGNDAWQLVLKTDYDNGYINLADFIREEGVWRAYNRVSNDTIDTSLLSVQGIGEPVVNGLVLSFTNTIGSIISVGDEVRNSTLQLVGVIQDRTDKTLTLDTVNNIVSGDFVLASKPQSVEIAALLGYYMRVDASLSKNTYTELFAVNTEVAKSYI